jgi:hypothetical protein
MQANAKVKGGRSREGGLGRGESGTGVKPTLRGAASVGTGRAVGSLRSPRPPGSASRSLWGLTPRRGVRPRRLAQTGGDGGAPPRQTG